MLDKARETYTSVDALFRALMDTEDDRDGWSLVHFVRPPERRQDGAQFVDIEPRDREWLAPLLLAAAQARPGLIVRNLIHIVGDQDVWAGLPERDASTLLERVYTLHPEHVDTIFGEYAVSLLEVLANNDASDGVARSAAIQAKKRLTEIALERDAQRAAAEQATAERTAAEQAGSESPANEQASGEQRSSRRRRSHRRPAAVAKQMTAPPPPPSVPAVQEVADEPEPTTK